MKKKNIIILSEKSSGSSAFQSVLTRFAVAQHVPRTRHFENETLYWTKAASVLRLPQLKMVDSEVPIGRDKARLELISLLTANLGEYIAPSDDRELIFGGWTLLCHEYGPIFLEKSPHHLCQWSALELILEFIDSAQDVDVLLIGLIRNPMDTIFSQYKRFGSSPAAVEQQWNIAYQNLLDLKEIMRDQLVIVRYEDLVVSLECLMPILEFCGVSPNDAPTNHFHRKSLQKWKRNPFFGFRLARSTMQLATRFGYDEDQMANEARVLWPVARLVSRFGRFLATAGSRLIRTERG